MEVYSPPYLFNGVDGAGNPIPAKRPKVERVRLGASYGQRFTIHTPEAREIATVVLIRCSSVTHNFNPDQRYVGLVVDKVTRTLTSLTVNAPPTPEIAPPGYYMLFILTGGEKPSVANFFRLQPTYPLMEVYLGRDGAMGNAPAIEAEHGVIYDAPILDLGTIRLGQSRKGTIQCTNVGSGELRVRNPTLKGDFRDQPIPASPRFGGPARLKNTTLVLSPSKAGPGNSAILEATFTPKEYGLYSGSLSLETSAPDARGFTIDLKARVEGLKLEITPMRTGGAALNFGDVPVGADKVLVIAVRNVGTMVAYVSDLLLGGEAPGGQFHIPFVGANRTIGVGQVETYNIAYIPTVVGDAEATVQLVAVGMLAPSEYHETYSIALVGTGLGPVVDFDPPGLTFADQLVRTVSSPQRVVLKNIGSGPLTITDISVSSEFTQTNSCPASLDSGQSCDIAVSFRPAGGGSRAGLLTVESNAMGSPPTVALNGRGLVEPIVTLSAASLSFGNQPVGTSGAEQTVTLKNDGAANGRNLSVSVTGANASDFVVATNSCSGSIIPPEGICEVRVRFNPSATGSRSAILELSSNAGGSPHRVALSGIGVTPPVRTLNPTSLDFGNQPVASRSTPMAVILKNNGTMPLTIGEIRVTGPNVGDFNATADTCRGASIAPGANCTVSMAFSPTALGRRSAGLTFHDNAPSSPHTVPLEGMGTGPVLSWDPPRLVFPPEKVGAFSQRQEVILRNTGNVMLTISSITVSGDFRHRVLGNTSLPPRGFCPIQVIFAPTVIGTCSGHLIIVSNAAGSPHQVPLSGEGAPPPATLSPTSVTFGSQQAGSTSAAMTVTVTNTGLVPLDITSTSLAGDNPGDFVKGMDSCAGSILQPGNTCSVEVRFAPTASGSRRAELFFITSHEPLIVPLTGSGS